MTNNVTHFDLSSFPASAPSICIPRVFQNITERRVWAIFENLGFGEVVKIDMVQRTNKQGEKFQRVFIHFGAWNDTDEATVVRQKLLGEEEVKVVYDEPWYWLLSASKSIRPEDRTQRKRRPRPYVDLNPSRQQQPAVNDLDKQCVRETVKNELSAMAAAATQRRMTTARRRRSASHSPKGRHPKLLVRSTHSVDGDSEDGAVRSET